MKNTILSLLTILFGLSTVFAQSEKDSVKVHFRVSDTHIDPEYKGNGTTLDSIFSKLLADSISDPTHRLVGVKVTGAASPEGSVKFNRYLSEKRADAIFNEFRSRGLLADSMATFEYIGRDWQGLQREVEKDPNVPYQAEVLSLLEKINGSNPPSHPLADLKNLNGGVPYRYLLSRLFPDLRASRLSVEYERVYPFIEVPDFPLEYPDITMNLTGEILPRPFALGSVKECRPFYMGLKTNMLYDALLIPNIGAEFYVGKNVSLTADWMYGWWDRDRTHYYWRAYGGNLGARWWFGKEADEKPLTGHHLGIFAGVITYDFELGKGGIMGGIPRGTLWDRCNFISGIEYGYSLPVAKRLNIDFSLALGYMGGKYIKYEPKHGFYIWQSTHRLHWFGPTKAEISLVWLIGCDNYNRSKGGKK
ncbi:MAG: DUF3575 domain-containing protein [Muribaculaceae bacterium]|nr:DUF3575 domain-containing protein [Muribaculaceae bacterium]MDE6554223.1 DUF3575 domain-containing protein [Muribaculaceae bacterium]